MKITIFTSNQNRHNYFINELSKICDHLYIIQECRSIFPGQIKDIHGKSKDMENYFYNVLKAEKEIFKNSEINFSKKNITLLPMLLGDLQKCTLKSIGKFLSSDIFIVFGSSFIKGEIVNFLIKKKAINIHMGISPYYRGADCNFWALYDDNPDLVGATIHYLSKGLDSGSIIYHVISNCYKNPYIYTMSTVMGAIQSIIKKIKSNSLHIDRPKKQNLSKQIKCKKKIDFNDRVIKIFNKKKFYLKKKKNNNYFINPYLIKKV